MSEMKMFSVVDAVVVNASVDAQGCCSDLQAGSRLIWSVAVAPGRYTVEVEIACQRHASGSLYEVRLGGRRIRGVVPRTENMQTFLRLYVGTLEIDQPNAEIEWRLLSGKETCGRVKALYLTPMAGTAPVQVDSVALPDADFSGLPLLRSDWQEGFIGGAERSVHALVQSGVTGQTILGIGGAFNEQGGDVLFALPEAERERVLNNLFGTEGVAFSCCYFPIGASDFALSPYSLDDVADDYDMAQFSSARDEERLVPYIKAAQAVNPEMTFHARPWSPPAWMKDSGKPGTGSLKATPEIYRAYALYLCKAVERMKELGIEIKRLVIQNEPDVGPGYVGCIYTPEQYAEFFVTYLRPLADERGLEAELWAGSFQAIWKATAARVMEQPGMLEAADGVAVQYNSYDAVLDLRLRWPELPMMHTESACHGGANSETEALMIYGDAIRYLRLGSTTYSYWNMILDRHATSYYGWKQNAMITIDKVTGEVVYNPEYHVMRLLSAHIRPGAVRLECFCFERMALAVRNPDGTVVVFVDNPARKAVTVNVYCDGRVIPVEIPPTSINAVSVR